MKPWSGRGELQTEWTEAGERQGEGQASGDTEGWTGAGDDAGWKGRAERVERRQYHVPAGLHPACS